MTQLLRARTFDNGFAVLLGDAYTLGPLSVAGLGADEGRDEC